jgi:hypothetical protein
MRIPALGSAKEGSLTNSVEPEANQAAVGCDPEISIIHGEIVHDSGEVTLPKRTKRRGVEAYIPHSSIPGYPKARTLGYKPPEPAEQRRQIRPERPGPAPRIPPEQGITGEGHDGIG